MARQSLGSSLGSPVGPLDNTFAVPGLSAPCSPALALGTFAPQGAVGTFAGPPPSGGGPPLSGFPIGSGVMPATGMPMGSGAFPMAGAPPMSMGSVPATEGPPRVGPFATQPPASSPYGEKYEIAKQQVQGRLHAALEKKAELEASIEEATNGLYSDHLRTKFSQARQANLTGIDWRVPRLQYCKDPKYNREMHPTMAYEVQERKAADSRVLEYELSKEANAQWAAALVPCGMAPPPLERVHKPKVPFVEANPGYIKEDDVWSRKLDLRTLEEAMRGDVSKPMARPVLFAEDYENYQQGKYVKDDCPIA